MRRLVVALVLPLAAAGERVGSFPQEVRRFYTTADGLPSDDVRAMAVMPDGAVYAGTGSGLARLAGTRWERVAALPEAPVEALAASAHGLLAASGGVLYRIRGEGAERLAAAAGPAQAIGAGAAIVVVAGGRLLELAGERLIPPAGFPGRGARHAAVASDGRLAVAAETGLYLREASGTWRTLYPRDERRSWAPQDVRAVAFDRQDRLWFASAQGAGREDSSGWQLYTGADGLPYDDFTALAAGPQGQVWFGTTRGAIRRDASGWAYRQGLRWLPDDDVRAIALAPNQDAWFATSKGAGAITHRSMGLAEKARFFEDEIDKRHRRTAYGYVLGVTVKRPGDAGEWTQHDSDNDGLWTAMYGAGECFAYAATKDPAAKKRAKAAFEALRFLGTVTQGGKPPAPRGFVARTVLPASGANPNLQYTKERDEQFRATRDSRWKVLSPRWPLSADGQWYWKSDTSSDELDGHFFFYGVYYDLAADTEGERQRVREVVAGITDHLIEHNFTLVDWDGTPTRWAVFNPEALNQDKGWWAERGLNSLSILTYLRVAEHVTGDRKYGAAYDRLVKQHSYAANAMVAKIHNGPGSGNQSDDEMAFMDYYNLLRYETDPDLREMYTFSLARYWQIEEPELNPLFNFIYAAAAKGRSATNTGQPIELGAQGRRWLEESLDTLKRFPLDRFDWRHTNSHRKDLVPLRPHARDDRRAAAGHRRDGTVLPIDERFVDHWNHDPWQLDQGGRGLGLADGAAFLLPYYLGRYHGFIEE